jgi:glycosyltransferase involved in cell wall biosynthesis
LSPQERHVIRVCRDADGVDLERSPIVLEPVQCSEVATQHVPTGSPSGLRASVIDDWLPRLGRDAGSTAILSHFRSLQRLGYRVSIVAALEFDGPAADRAALDAIGVMCCCSPDYGWVEEVLQRQAGEFDVIYLHRVANAAKYGELVRHHCPKARLVYSVADLHHLRLARQAAAEDRPELIGMARRFQLLEFTAAFLSDRVITHSAEEAKLLKAQVGAAKAHTVRWSACANPTAVPFARRHGIAFIGYYEHAPNLDAARWLIAEIMPLVRRRDPTIECLLVGSGLPDALRRCCGEGVVTVGHVEDLGEIFDRVRLTVAPLAYGAGMKGKIVDSLAAGVPCVCTPIAAEGMDLPPALHASIADGAEAIAAAIHHLHCDQEANDACRQASLQYIEAMFSEERLDATMRDVVGPNPTPLPVVTLEPRPKAATAA